MQLREDKELKEFADIMPRPESYEDGFGWKTVVMAVFVGLLMTPAQMYMQLVAGVEMGPAAQWVTVILYVEVSRRAFAKLKRPEIFVLFYMCGAVIHAGTGTGNLLWHQFVVQSEELRKMGITEYIPTWFAPSDPDVLNARSFFMQAWITPLILMVMMMFITRLDHFGLGYVMFRLTADVEELPFPMAPVGAMGMTALADASDQKDTWRWRTFSMGAMGGIAFGFIYLAIPNITGAIFSSSLKIIPLPFFDMTRYTESFLPAMPMMISFDLTFVVIGMVLPFWAMMGGLIGLIFTMIANPILYHTGVLDNWVKGIGAIQTIQSNVMDFYFSFRLGLMFAVAAIGFIHVFSSFRKKRKDMDINARTIHWGRLFKRPEGRGDPPIWASLGIYLFSTTAYIVIAYALVNYLSGPLYGNKFPLWLLIFYGFVYTPLISYVSSRMEGIVGQQVRIPFVREATFILSGYKGAAIWFTPIPMHDYARQVRFFKTTELTGTKFSSLIKAEILIFPIIMVGSVLFSQFIWSMGPVPSEMFPYADEFWELRAYQQGLMWSATLPGEAASPFLEAFKPTVLAIGFTVALSVYAMLNHFGLPVFLVYGVVRGLDQSVPHAILPMCIGALLGRLVFRKWFGKKWPQYRIVFNAGFVAGIGLITMVSLGFVLMSKSVIKLVF
jgi:hypothetical protein